MKLSKAETCIIVVTLVFAALTVGVCAGRDRSAAFTISTQRTGEAASLAPAAEPGESGPEPEEDAPVNINTATVEELCTLEGIGETLARRIVAYREEHGPFASVGDITRVEGIGAGKFQAIRDRITVS